MKIIQLIFSLLFCLSLSGQINDIAERLGYEKDSKLLIIHGDDIGVSNSVNNASFKGFQNNAINSGSVMIPSPWIKEVADFYNENPNYDLGLHLTLTAEWKNYKWNGVSSSNQISSLLNDHNEFYDNTSDVDKYANPNEVRKELQAQIDFSRKLGLDPTHVDTHMGSLAVNKNLWREYIEVAHENKLVSMVTKLWGMSLFDDNFPMPEYIVPVDDIYMLYPESDREFVESVVGKEMADQIITYKPYDYQSWFNLYSSKIKSLQPGLNVFLLHLGYDNDELKAITIDHPEYGSLWRQLDFEVFNSKEMKELIKKEEIKLVTWGQIRKLIYDY
jgi:hypothetical protein